MTIYSGLVVECSVEYLLHYEVKGLNCFNKMSAYSSGLLFLLMMHLGRNGGTPLHHAAKRGLENIVNLLLAHGGMSIKPLFF